MSRNKEHRGAAFGGAPNGAAAFIGSVFVCFCSFISVYYEYFMDIPYIFLIYFIFICPKYFPYISFVCFVTYYSQQIGIEFFNRGGGGVVRLLGSP